MKNNACLAPSLATLCLQVEMTGVTNEDQLIVYVKRYNDAIKLKQVREKPLDLKYILRRFRQLKAREYKQRFMNEHDCRECAYFHKVDRCLDRGMCVDDLLQAARNRAREEQRGCPNSPDGACVYANESGRCFGCCMQKILNADGTERPVA